MLKTIISTTLLALTGIVTPARSQAPVNLPPTRAQVANACIQNRADTLPIPFKDVSPKDWAFKAVMTMYYCGAFRQAAPPALFQQTQPTQSQVPKSTQSVRQPN